MFLRVNGTETFVATGGRDFEAALPAIILLHGAGLDHTTWALHSRWFAYRGHAVLAIDLPGHGRSLGAALTSVAAMADWIAALLAAAGVPRARLIGHSMGSLVALEVAARHPDLVSSLDLIGAAAAMKVGADLLNAAAADDPAAIAMMSLWGLGGAATLGGNLAPGLWMLGGARRVLEANRPGVLFADLTACNDYRGALAAAARIAAPVTLILGERDLMTPLRSGKELAASLPQSRTVILPGAGHLLPIERPDEVLAALTRAIPAAA